MRLLPLTALLTVINLTYAASDSTDKTPWQPCTAESTTSGNFFDINPLQIQPPSSDSPSKSKKKDNADLHSWHARGYDYHANFTLNFCGPVVEKLDDVEDLQKSMWKNVSAYYEKSGRTYAIGLESQEPVIRGRKLVLNYTHGSLCPAKAGERRGRLPVDDADPRDEDVGIWRGKDDDDEDEDDGKRRKGNKDSERRKSTIISLLCERNPKDGDPLVTVSYVGSVDECTYFFEARSTAACATTKVANQPLGPGSVFGIIALVTILVYLIGGIMYQRIVQHQRGWRQLPNYSLWSSIFGFVSDMTIIVFSSLGRCLPGFGRLFGGRKGGYSRLDTTYEESAYANGTGNARSGRGTGSGSEDENRLIDQLDEQWEE